MIIKQYDVVKASRDINEQIKKGCLGSVVHLYDREANTFLVEFVNDKNETIDVLNVEISDLEST